MYTEFLVVLTTSVIYNFIKRILAVLSRRRNINTFFFRHIDYRIIIKVLSFFHWLCRKNYGCNNGFLQTHFNILGYKNPTTHAYCIMRQRVLNNALAYGNKSLHQQLIQCKAKLQSYINDNNISSQLIYAPLHTVSDILPAVLAGMASEKKVNVISVHNGMEHLVAIQKDNIYGFTLEQFNPSVMEGNDGTKLTGLVLSLMNDESNLVIFPDALPECTNRFTPVAMKTQDVVLFNKKAALHAGIYTFSRLLKQPALVYCLYFNSSTNQLDVDILGCVNFRDIHNQMPALIETGITKYSKEWIMWHYESFYCFNSQA